MDQEWLEERLAEGRSIESNAREVGKNASTVGYWVRKHGLVSSLAGRHAARGPIDAAVLARLVGEGLTLQQMAERLGVGATTIRHWLSKHGLRTSRSLEVASTGEEVELRVCAVHGHAAFVRTGSRGHYRCRRCRTEHVTRRRRRVKAVLVAEAGGRCALCGYDRFPGALQFHHIDPAAKAFGLATHGVARSLEKARTEARKCVLLCANCHAEVEGGLATIPRDAA